MQTPSQPPEFGYFAEVGPLTGILDAVEAGQMSAFVTFDVATPPTIFSITFSGSSFEQFLAWIPG